MENTKEEEKLNNNDKDEKLYSVGWITAATYLGGPLAGAYLLYKNFKFFKKDDYASNALKYGILATLIIFTSLPFVPEAVLDKIPNSLIPLIYTIVIYYIAHKYQENDINSAFDSGVQKHSGWRAFGISILALIITMIYAFPVIILFTK